MSTPEAPRRDLLIGWGNALREDDGVGRAIAAEAESWGLANLCVIERTHLTPELAPVLAAARRVLFVDAAAEAAAGPGRWRLEPLLPPASGPADGSPTSELFSHHTSAGGLLQLANTLYGRRPPAWQLLVTAHGMGLSTELTPTTKALLPELLAAVRRWCSGDA